SISSGLYIPSKASNAACLKAEEIEAMIDKNKIINQALELILIDYVTGYSRKQIRRFKCQKQSLKD
ncbi:MAG: hypothetical protein ACKO2T_26655, partial [Microcystis aeruginosa]